MQPCPLGRFLPSPGSDGSGGEGPKLVEHLQRGGQDATQRPPRRPSVTHGSCEASSRPAGQADSQGSRGEWSPGMPRCLAASVSSPHLLPAPSEGSRPKRSPPPSCSRAQAGTHTHVPPGPTHEGPLPAGQAGYLGSGPSACACLG